MPSNTGYSITTRRLRLCCGHPEWLRKTQDFYNEIESFYYDLLLAHEELGELGDVPLQVYAVSGGELSEI